MMTVKEESNKKKVVCEICGNKEIKYRCPSCMMRTCCLQCVKDHKVLYECNGKRCKTSYVSKTDYNYNNMMSDYRFLEDTERVAYMSGSTKTHRHLNRSATTLLKKARQSGVTLKLMPTGMTKRLINTSHYNNRTKCIMWRVQWLFVQANKEYVSKKVSENIVLIELLQDYIDPVESDPVIRQSLKPYLQTPVEKVLVFLKKEYQPANQDRYYAVDINKTLKENLQGNTIIEFPTFHVVTPDKADMFTTQETLTTLANKKPMDSTQPQSDKSIIDNIQNQDDKSMETEECLLEKPTEEDKPRGLIDSQQNNSIETTENNESLT